MKTFWFELYEGSKKVAGEGEIYVWLEEVSILQIELSGALETEGSWNQFDSAAFFWSDDGYNDEECVWPVLL